MNGVQMVSLQSRSIPSETKHFWARRSAKKRSMSQTRADIWPLMVIIMITIHIAAVVMSDHYPHGQCCLRRDVSFILIIQNPKI